MSSRVIRLLSLGLVLCFAFATTAVSADDRGTEPRAKITAKKSFRSSTLSGLRVYNKSGDEVGSINDMVINMETGKVEYAALSVGGFLGIGDKLFAVPWRMLTLRMEEDGNHFVLDISKDVLSRAPGFDQDHWPDMADPNWAEEIERYYGTTSHVGQFKAFEDNQLVMVKEDGTSQHTHYLSKDLVIVSDGKKIASTDLKAGDRIRVTVTNVDGKSFVSRIERM